jgi:DnaJ-class molecular chaperone
MTNAVDRLGSIQWALNIFGLSNELPSKQELRTIYLNLLRKTHPDKSSLKLGSNSNSSSEDFINVQAAWKILIHSQQTNHHDNEENECHYDLDANLSDLTFNYDLNEFTCSCRCGDVFIITSTNLNDGMNTFPCNSCSLLLRVRM